MVILNALLQRLQNSQIQLSRGVISENFVEVDVKKPAHAYFAVGVTGEAFFKKSCEGSFLRKVRSEIRDRKN